MKMFEALKWVWLAAMTVAVGYLVLERNPADHSDARFEEITAERLNIVQPDGTPRLILANDDRFPGLFKGGREYMHFNRRTGGMLFLNNLGDEVGGMTFDATVTEEGYRAGAGLMFDQFQQDQTVGVQYSDANGQRVAGFRVWDRPDWSIEPVLEYSDRIARAATDDERTALITEMREFALAQEGGVGAERYFAGKQLDDALVRLNDAEGRPRLVLRVNAHGDAAVEFLDSEGSVTRSITP